jgi:hypothetical protein
VTFRGGVPSDARPAPGRMGTDRANPEPGCHAQCRPSSRHGACLSGHVHVWRRPTGNKRLPYAPRPRHGRGSRVGRRCEPRPLRTAAPFPLRPGAAGTRAREQVCRSTRAWRRGRASALGIPTRDTAPVCGGCRAPSASSPLAPRGAAGGSSPRVAPAPQKVSGAGARTTVPGEPSWTAAGAGLAGRPCISCAPRSGSRPAPASIGSASRTRPTPPKVPWFGTTTRPRARRSRHRQPHSLRSAPPSAAGFAGGLTVT